MPNADYTCLGGLRQIEFTAFFGKIILNAIGANWLTPYGETVHEYYTNARICAIHPGIRCLIRGL